MHWVSLLLRHFLQPLVHASGKKTSELEISLILSFSGDVQEGVMGVHDEETKRFFKNSAVRCKLAPRYADAKLSWFRQQVSS